MMVTMFAALVLGTVVGFHGSTSVSSRSAAARRPTVAMVEALARDGVLRDAASGSKVGPEPFVREHFACTPVTLRSGETLVLVRFVTSAAAMGWCGMHACGFEVLSQRGSGYRVVLNGLGRTLDIFGDGTIESSAEMGAGDEDYRTFRWTGQTFVSLGEYDTLGAHTPIASATPIVLNEPYGYAEVSGTIEGIGPGKAYDVAGKKGQTLTLTLSAQNVRHLAVDHGPNTLVVVDGSSLSLRLPEDGFYRIVVMKDDTNFAAFTLQVNVA